ncbi:hypothetical protein PC118_g15394 [Phytophthora cactorum]|uniref:Uncharacterized protein n=1 Tax=Phytophthora cactorum TaxID=29920 RepID=A0A8T1FI52_9STRA|nr:hypothetical protein PC112_g14719 [Phytophthora cactorum]KAG2815088.1 hypothetical protein PC111_g13716 [Phytophthora cactorum]KAG2904889.1 hypothetical protein PC115_g14813 [Phytophthora cactorum]KAG2972957.1 hypothetical protein PC118_g15394 [Phytophthora cactorum]KAG3074244.1 hypothetical protein PC122_g14480 [Phytophthora cactorum]
MVAMMAALAAAVTLAVEAVMQAEVGVEDAMLAVADPK